MSQETQRRPTSASYSACVPYPAKGRKHIGIKSVIKQQNIYDFFVDDIPFFSSFSTLKPCIYVTRAVITFVESS